MRWLRKFIAAKFPSIAPKYKAARWQNRLVLLNGFDLTIPDEIKEIDRIVSRAAAHGLTGAALAGHLDSLPGSSERYLRGLDQVVEICRKNDVELIPAGFSFGFGEPFLQANRHLAEGLPVKDAPFVAGDDGMARLIPDPAVSIRNGNFELHDGDVFQDFGFQDMPGIISFADYKVCHSGRCSLRLENFKMDQWGHGRINQMVPVRPHRTYRISLWVKTEGLNPPGVCRLTAMAPEDPERDLLIRDFEIPETMDWRRLTMVLNSQHAKSITLFAGVWGGREGKVWLDDWTIREIGPQHVLRRPGTPVTVRSEDGDALYEEGRDFERLVDPDMNLWQNETPAPDLKLLPEGRIKPGDKLRLSWYHPFIVYAKQVGTCMAEPEIYRIAENNAKALVERIRPRRVLLEMASIFSGGTCEACAGKDMAALLGESVNRIAGIFRKLDPSLEIMTYSDMFDPHHQALKDFHFIRGDLFGSWRALPRNTTMVTWGKETRNDSLDFLAGKGFPVIVGCYLDADDLTQTKEWIRLAKLQPNVRGFIYMTWFRRFRHLNNFCDLISR